jgi:GxxExxY protein
LDRREKVARQISSFPLFAWCKKFACGRTGRDEHRSKRRKRKDRTYDANIQSVTKAFVNTAGLKIPVMLPLKMSARQISSFPLFAWCKKFSCTHFSKKLDELSRVAIGAAIEVHRLKGPGLIESIYERCLMRELELHQIATVNQRLVRIEYKGLVFDEPLRFDVLVEGCLLLELKCVQKVLPIHKAQILSYMKLLDIPLGLIINFHEMKLTDGVVRMILPGANREG